MSTNISNLQQGGNKPANFPAMLKASFAEVARALPRHLNPDRMSRIALTAFRRNPKLAQCDPRSVIASVIQASQLGLEIDTLGRAFLVPYGRECQFIPGWKGLVELVNRSGQGTVWTGAVFQGDEFDYSLGDSPFVKHKPAGEFDPQLLQFAYAIGRPTGSEWPIIEVWPIARVIKHRDRYNKVGKGHYSFDNLEMYARKTALMQVLKYMPMSPEMVQAVELDAAGQAGEQHLDTKDAIDGTWTPVAEVEPVSDSNGEVFNPENHLAPDKFNQDGSYTKRPQRGKKAAAGKKTDPLDQIIAAMKAAGSVDMLAEAREEGNDPDLKLDDVQKLRLDDIFHTCMEKLKGGSSSSEAEEEAGFEGLE